MKGQNSRYRGMTREKALEIRRAYFRREGNQRQLAEKYGIPRSTIAGIIANRVWRE